LVATLERVGVDTVLAGDLALALVAEKTNNCYPIDRVVGVISQRYVGDDETIRTGVQELITSLEAASLIVPADAPPSPKEPEPKATGDSAEKSPFVAPKLNTYSDMKNLLLLDPIHDAADGAWPNRD
jgi:hypothetical protein